MTLDQALEEAKLKYRVGDIVENQFNCTFKIEILNCHKYDESSIAITPYQNKLDKYTLYTKGTWAKILNRKTKINVFVGIKIK